MDSHNRFLSILHIIYGGLQIVLYLLLVLFINSFLPFIMDEIHEANENAEMIVSIGVDLIRSVGIILILIIPVPSVIGGFALLNQKEWGLSVMMISGCLSLLSFPIGTGLGVYTIWVYLENNKKESNDEN